MKKKNKNILSVLRGHKSSVTSLVFSNKREIFSGDLDGNIICWNIEIYRPKFFLTKIHNVSVLNLYVLNSKLLFSQGRGVEVVCTNLDTKKKVFSIPFKQYSFCKFDCDGDKLLILEEKTIGLYSIKGEKVGDIEKIDNKVNGMVLVSDFGEENVFVGYENGNILIYDKNTFKFLKKITNIHINKPVLSVSQFSNLIISSGADNNICITDFNSLKTIMKYSLEKEGINVIKNDGKRIFLTAGWDNRIRVYDMKKHKPLTILKYHGESVNCIDVLNVGENSWIVCSGSRDKRIVLWNLKFNRKKKKV